MMRSLFAGVSGLRNHQTRMDVIGNNIANVNTVGFKASRVQFQDVLSQTLQGASGTQGSRGGTNPMQVGLGMGLASIDTVFTDGSFQPTGKQTDLSIQGQGFFVLQDQTGGQVYTRAGNFDFDNAGNYLVPGTGYKVMGWMANAGVLSTAGTPTSIQIPVGASMAARPSTQITYANNLSGSDPIGAITQTSINVFDSLGSGHKVNQTFTKVANNTWLAYSQVPDSTGAITGAYRELTFNPSTGALNTVTNINPGATGTTTLAPANTFRLNDTAGSVETSYFTAFGSDGVPYEFKTTFTRTAAGTWTYNISAANDTKNTVLYTDTATLLAGPQYDLGAGGSFTLGTATVNIPGAPFNGAASGAINLALTTYTPAAVPVPNLNFTPTGGAVAMSVFQDFSALTQFGGESTIQATNQDGYASGTLSSTSIDPAGIIVGRFTNGQSQNLAQVALATFNNSAGLNKVGDNLFGESTNSGVAQVGPSGTGGRGKFSPGTLEMANVDLAQEFSNMIITQRGFQANSKIISTDDEMLQELANLKR